MRFVSALRPNFHLPSSRRARGSGFTLYELLIVVAVLVVALAILVPVIIRARTAAMNVVCTSRLRDLYLATNAYKLDQSVLPEPAALTLATGPGTGVLAPSPHHIDTRLLRQLERYLKYPRVTHQTAAIDLPPLVQCPFMEREEHRGPFAALEPTVGYFYTGYAYVGRVEEVPQPTPQVASILGLGIVPPITLPPVSLPPIGVSGALPILPPTTVTLGPLQIQAGTPLKKDRAAPARPSKRAVVWTDDVHWDGSGRYWQYSHMSGKASAGPKPLTRASAGALAGQHRAFTDGTVEWVEREDMGLIDMEEIEEPSPSLLNLSASFRIGSNSSSYIYWWF